MVRSSNERVSARWRAGRGSRMCLALAQEIRAARPAAGLVIFSYLNPMLRYGLRKFADDAAAAGVDGVLATDMIVEEAGEYLAELAAGRACADFSGCADEPR